MDTDTFFSALFDFSFERFATTSIVKALYALAFLAIAIYSLVVFVALASGGGGYVLVAIVVAPLAFIIALAYTRVLLEVLVVLHRVGEDTRRMADTLTTAPPPSGGTPGPTVG